MKKKSIIKTLARFYGEMFRGRNWQTSAKRYILIHAFHLLAIAVIVEICRNGILRWEPLMVLFSLIMIAGFGVVVEWWGKPTIPNETYQPDPKKKIDEHID